MKRKSKINASAAMLVLAVATGTFGMIDIASAQTWSSTDADPPAQRNQPFGQQNGVSSGTEVYVYPGGQTQYPQYPQNSQSQYGQQYPQQRPQYPNGNYQAYPQQQQQNSYPQDRRLTQDERMQLQRDQMFRDRTQNYNSPPPLRNPTYDEQVRAGREAVRQNEAANEAARRVMEAEARKRKGLPPQ